MIKASRHSSSDGEGGGVATDGVAGTAGADTVVMAGADIIAPTTAIAPFMGRASTARITGDSATVTRDTTMATAIRTAGTALVLACGNRAGLEMIRARFAG
jgi:hypothetical protein